MRRLIALAAACTLLVSCAYANVTVTFGGDCTIGCLEKQKLSENGFRAAVDEYGYDWFFSGILPVLEADDLTLVNCEGTFTESTARKKKTYNFKAPADYVNILQAGSVEAVNIANNHIYDYGDEGYHDTLQVLEEAGILCSGGDITAEFEANGLRIGMIGRDIFDGDSGDIRSAVKTLRQNGCDIVIASFHWGIEYQKSQNSNQKKIGRAAIDAGADIVIGHHPHIVQGIERYQGKYILYSLGNLVFGGNTDPDDRDAYLARVTFDESGVRQLQVIPVRLTEKTKNTDYRPVLAEGEQADQILKRIGELSSGIRLIRESD